MTKIQRAIVAVAAAGGLAWASAASAQIPFTSLNGDPGAANAAFPLQNPRGPAANNYQVNYPYPGQCVADAKNAGAGNMFPTLTTCPTTGSFSSPSQRTAGGWAATGLVPFKVLNPITANSTAAAAVPTPKYVWEFLNPPDYTPDTGKYSGADYYELGVHESWGFQALAGLDLFPDPLAGRCSNSGAYCDAANPCLVGGAAACAPIYPGAPGVPNGMQWTGLVCTIAGGCSCPADAVDPFKSQYCSASGKVPLGYPLYTPVWGVGQINMGGTAGVTLPPNPYPTTGTAWSQNQYLATWPSISIRSIKGRPVVVKWVNEFPNNHVLCPHPEAADWPCAIDRTFMGVKATLDPAIAAYLKLSVPYDGVNRYGSPQQPDNSWVTHLHGGEIPPSVDGFAEKWFGNSITGPIWTPDPAGNLVTPAFENPSAIALKRPGNGNFDVYTYPMVNEEATIWFHDHTLGKTHHNVIAGPAGFAPTWDPTKHGGVGTGAGTCPTELGLITTPPVPTTCTADYTWLDPVSRPTAAGPGNLKVPIYDLYIAVQDRAFNDDGSFNFSDGLGQPVTPPPPLSPAAVAAPGYSSLTNGVNPLVHPVWIPEYFNDHAVINGVLWPKKSTQPGWYRMRIVDGSDSRCYNFGFQVSSAPPAPGAAVTFNVPFYVIANDQGYLKQPVKATGNNVLMCPGERYEILVDFGNLKNGVAAGAAAKVYMVNNAKAPYPAGVNPQAVGSPFAEMNTLMLFDVNPAFGPGVKSCGAVINKIAVAPPSLNWNAANPNGNMTKSTAVGTATVVAAGYYDKVCMPDLSVANTLAATFLDKSMRSCTATACAPTLPTTGIVRQVYMNERIDGTTLAPMGMQLNGVPFEYKVTETPKKGTTEVWKFINLTVDTHPMHPHFIRHQIVERQNFNVGQYKKALCGSTSCQPGTAPGGEMQVVPDVTGTYLAGNPPVATAYLTGTPVLPDPGESGWKDTSAVPPGMVTTIVAEWTPHWNSTGTPNAPGTTCNGAPCTVGSVPWIYEDVTSGPYVWHCHINSHEDSEMMRTSLVVP